MTDAEGLLWTKRQFTYSVISIIFAPFLYISLTFTDLIQWVIQKEELPFDTILYIGLGEIFKIAITLWLIPVNNYVGTGFTVFGTSDIENKSFFKLPFARKDTLSRIPYRTTSLTGKIVNWFWSISSFIVALGLCHSILILFGAPLIQDWILTFHLSLIIVCFLFLPLCLIFQPRAILSELFYISAWDNQCQFLLIAKWRFLLSCFGVWCGAIVFPLDWDRPWQKWPIPCVFSAALSHILVNIGLFFYLLYWIYGNRLKVFLFPKLIHKVKSL